MKDFIDDIKYASRILPGFLVVGACVGGIIYLFGDTTFALQCFLLFVGVWAVIFVAIPSIVFVLAIINHVLDTHHKTPNKKK